MSVNNRLTSKDVEVYSLPMAIESGIILSEFKCEKQNFADYLRVCAEEDDKNNVAKVWLFVNRNKEVICNANHESVT